MTTTKKPKIPTYNPRGDGLNIQMIRNAKKGKEENYIAFSREKASLMNKKNDNN